MPPLPRNNSRSGKAAKRALEGAARAPVEGDNRRTVPSDNMHIGYKHGFHGDAYRLSMRVRKMLGLEHSPQL